MKCKLVPNRCKRLLYNSVRLCTYELGLSIICLPEIISALNRRAREKSITTSQYKKAKVRLSEEINDAVVVHLNPDVIHATIVLLERFSLRAMDAIHIACAEVWEADRFVTADRKQFDAAIKIIPEVMFL